MAVDRSRAAEQIGDGLVVDPPAARRDPAAQAEAAGPAGHVEIGGDVEQADAVDQIIVHPALDRGEIAAGGEIEGERERGVDPVGAQPQIVRDQPRAGDAELAVHPDVGDRAAGDRVEAEDPVGRGRDRDDDVVGAHPGAAARAQALDRRGVEGEAGGAQIVGDAGRREGAVEDHRELDVAAAEIGRDRAGLDQPRGDAQILEAVAAEIDQPLGGERQRPAAERAAGCRRGDSRTW